MFQPDPWGILAIIAVAMSWTLAVVTFRASMAGSVGRKLSLLLVIEGLTLASSSAPLFILRYRAEFLDAHPLYTQFTNYLHLFGDCAMLALYPVFLSVALDTQLTRPFTRRDMRAALAAVAVSLYALVAFTPWQMEGISLLFLCLMATFIYAFTASFLAWRTATGLARSRAFVFVLAFGFRDLCWGYNYAYATVEMWLGRVPLAEGVDTGFMAYILGTLIAVPLIAYGILRTQLFDIDLRIRWTIKQSTFAACVVFISFVVSEGVEWLVSSSLGNLWGLVAAAVAVLFLRPLQQVSERVVSAIMPNTRDT
ncbi:MAG TPA: hypothetical protein VFG52_10025, partial [Xanthomonadales bacterium]|nr:hypothetical protein [Xanthomonadales bacterium]